MGPPTIAAEATDRPPIRQNEKESYGSDRAANEQPRTDKYEAPKLVDYGTLLDLTQVGGTVAPKDIPHGHPHSAFPVS